MATKAAKKKPQATGDMSENDLPTEAELLRMPESDYMNERQLGFFRDRLRQLETEILSNADETTEHLRETQLSRAAALYEDAGAVRQLEDFFERAIAGAGAG